MTMNTANTISHEKHNHSVSYLQNNTTTTSKEEPKGIMKTNGFLRDDESFSEFFNDIIAKNRRYKKQEKESKPRKVFVLDLKTIQ
jgi:hypothetical protein